jgi:hypothetical protein
MIQSQIFVILTLSVSNPSVFKGFRGAVINKGVNNLRLEWEMSIIVTVRDDPDCSFLLFYKR